MKKLIVALVTILWLPVYALLAMAIGIRVLPHANGVVTLAYYAVAGMAWIVPIGLMLPWMSRNPDKTNGKGRVFSPDANLEPDERT